MKSKTSCFNGVIFRKNLTRFAPVWCLYTLCLMLGMFLMLDRNIEYWFAANLASMCSGMALVNLGYALLTALVLLPGVGSASHLPHPQPSRGPQGQGSVATVSLRWPAPAWEAGPLSAGHRP